MLAHNMHSSEIELNIAQKELLVILEKYRLKLETHINDKSFFTKLFESISPKVPQEKCGLYIYGDVGRGKSMLMDMFFNALNIERKRREHFHQFMLDFHNTLHTMRSSKQEDNNDDVKRLAKQIASQVDALCFDELQVNNIADAMIVGRLFEALLQNGVFVVFTSNRPPYELFKDGLQRERFLPFIDLIQNKLELFELKSDTDYRLSKISSVKKLYLSPLNDETQQNLSALVELLTGGKNLEDAIIEIDENRSLRILRSYGNFAIFSFNELCQAALGAMDYIALSKRFSTIVVENIPRLTADHHNEALRFITLVDCLYEYHTKLICTAEVPIDELYAIGKNQFEFARTISRLKEMASKEYLTNEVVKIIESDS